MRLRRRAFAGLVDTQLELFASDHAQLLAECEEALGAYDDAAAEDAEERYGEYVDLADAVRDELELVRDGYAASLDERTAEAYEAAFNDAARRRFPGCTSELE
jgi:hypothetical protein